MQREPWVGEDEPDLSFFYDSKRDFRPIAKGLVVASESIARQNIPRESTYDMRIAIIKVLNTYAQHIRHGDSLYQIAGSSWDSALRAARKELRKSQKRKTRSN